MQSRAGPRSCCHALASSPANLSAVAQEKAAEDGGGRPQGPKDLYFMRQTIGNACGTIGLLHALANVRDSVSFGDTSTKSLDFTLNLAYSGEALSAVRLF